MTSLSNNATSLNFQNNGSAQTRKSNASFLAALLFAAIVSSLVVAADSVVDSHADGHLLLGWISLWAVGFAALAWFANSANKGANKAASRMSEFVSNCTSVEQR